MRHILITGASNGIGFATALSLSSNPDNRIFAISRNRQGLHHLQEKSEQKYGYRNLIPVDFDLTNLDQITESWAAHVLGRDVALDILINNAGILGKEHLVNYPSALSMNVFKTNFFAPMLLCKTMIPRMGAERTGHIVNIGSMSGFQGSSKFPGLSVYGASKSALASFTESLAVELSEKNIKVNCLALGSVQTEMLASAFPDYHAQLTPEDVGRFIADFALNGWQFFNGKVIPVASSDP
jgi:short-subunit dehydrogenase